MQTFMAYITRWKWMLLVVTLACFLWTFRRQAIETMEDWYFTYTWSQRSSLTSVQLDEIISFRVYGRPGENDTVSHFTTDDELVRNFFHILRKTVPERAFQPGLHTLTHSAIKWKIEVLTKTTVFRGICYSPWLLPDSLGIANFREEGSTMNEIFQHRDLLAWLETYGQSWNADAYTLEQYPSIVQTLLSLTPEDILSSDITNIGESPAAFSLQELPMKEFLEALTDLRHAPPFFQNEGWKIRLHTRHELVTIRLWLNRKGEKAFLRIFSNNSKIKQNYFQSQQIFEWYQKSRYLNDK